MGMGMGTRYPLSLGMGMRINIFYENRYGIPKPVPTSPVALLHVR